MKWQIVLPVALLAVVVSAVFDAGPARQARAEQGTEQQQPGPHQLAQQGSPPQPMQQTTQGMTQRMVPGVRQVANAYRSRKLKANLDLQWMSVPGYTFWGARIVGMDPDSPLRQANLQLGDVITRLDGVRISDSKYWNGSYWWLPEAERHFGRTEVRLVRSGTTRAENAYVNLGSSWGQHGPQPDVIVP